MLFHSLFIYSRHIKHMNLRKYLIQSLIYLTEIGIIIVVSNYILSCFFPAESYFDYFTRSLGIYTVYQLFVYSTLKLAADAQKDAYSTLKVMNEEALLIIKYYGNDYAAYFILSLTLKNHIRLQLDDSVFNMDEVKKEYIQLIKNIDTKNPFSIEHSIISINHNLTLIDQEFQFSFLLRAIKNSIPLHAKRYLNRFNKEDI